MPIERVFLGWDGPCLPRVAEWLCRRWGGDGGAGADLSRVAVVTPAARAGRRLLEILAEGATGPWVPPQFVTTGLLAEHLYEPPKPLASAATAQLCWMQTLRAAPPQLLDSLTPQPPEPDDLVSWFALAGDCQRMLAELRAHDLLPGDVARRGQTIVDFCDEDRWRGLQHIYDRYLACLNERGLADLHEARLAALREGTLISQKQIVLVAVTDLQPVLKDMLRRLPEGVFALVHAPDDEQAGFDDLGCPLPDHWAQRDTPVTAQMLRVAERPRDQADQVLLALAETNVIHGKQARVEVRCTHAPDKVTVGLGDEVLGPPIHRALELAGMPARLAVGRPLRATRPALLLEALASFLAGGRLDDFATLLRHPDIGTWLSRTVPDAATGSWLALLDHYATDHLHGRPTHGWLGDPAAAAKLKQVWDAVATFVPADAGQPHDLPYWAPHITRALVAVYEGHELTRQRLDHEALIESLGALGQALRQLTSASAATDPPLTLGQAMQLLVAALGELPLTQPGGPPAVELLGWLELHLDDAPALILTGFNEGCVPGSPAAHPLLPDRLRQVLGLEDHAHRYARDLYLLTAMIHSRPHVTLIAGRRGPRDEPLVPSRLALACDEEDLARRVAAFYGVGQEAPPPSPSLLWVEPGSESQLLIPPPRPPQPPLCELAVTAFRDYIACPYRFYLKHVLGLRKLDDDAVEMQASLFGDLAHDLLRQFARQGPAASQDAAEIRRHLESALDAMFADRFGPAAPVPALLQREQLRRRLAAFADWQARHAAAGWLILPSDTERKLKATLVVDGQPFTITGRIDRIDHHPEHGHWLLDYKTGHDDPEKAHRHGPQNAKQWKDLQLPLYRLLARQIGINDSVKLGYILLPKNVDDTGEALAKWDEDALAAADAKAFDVIRRIRAGIFWPPGQSLDPRRDFDGLSALCLDGCLQRDDVIRRVEALLAKAGGAP